jgi:sialate O-acetylesterase
MKKISLMLVITLMYASSIFAAIRLPNILGSHMVLQQKSSVKIWGWGAPEEVVTIKTNWDTTTYTTQTGNGAKWISEIKTPAAGGPYRITIAGSNEIVLEDVLIGEVWVCSGQSNMEWSGTQKLQQSTDEAPNANNKNIRFFYVSKATSNYPQENVDGHWVVCSPEEMFRFSAIGYFFGKNIQSNLNSPVGLINSNWGGTPAETWTPSYVIEESPVLSAAAKKQNSTPWWSPIIADTYNAMIAPLTQYAIAGVIWYQGESNVDTYYGYEELFTKMIGSWRKAWNAEFPFYFVQIAPYKYGAKFTGALLRASQTKAAQYPNTGMVVVSDLVPDTNNIHPTLKKEVAVRLANLALNKHYGFSKIVAESPSFDTYTIEKDKVIITFKNAPNGLMIKGPIATHFEIAGADQNFVAAQVKIDGNKIIVSSTQVKSPLAVRFGFSNTAMPNLFSKEGLPVNIFRTDNWELSINTQK